MFIRKYNVHERNIKLKQKYSNLFYSYWEQYDKWDINFTDLMVIQFTCGKILSSCKGAGRDTIHQICNFTYKWEESQQELRRDFCRFLYNMKTTNCGLNRDEKYCNWYKFLWNIIKHQTLKDKTITKSFIEDNYPSFPEYEESSNYIEVIRLLWVLVPASMDQVLLHPSPLTVFPSFPTRSWSKSEPRQFEKELGQFEKA